MNEKARTTSLFVKLFNGDPWIDVSMATVLTGINATQAAARPFPTSNSIWEITNHIINWRLTVLDRINGKIVASPANNYFEPVTDQSENAWADTIHRLNLTQKQWLDFLEEFDIANFERIYPPNGMTYYEHIHGIIQHDAYHLGQIVMLSKQL